MMLLRKTAINSLNAACNADPIQTEIFIMYNASIRIFEYFGFILLRKSFVSRYDSVALIFKMSIKLTKIAAQIIPTTR